MKQQSASQDAAKRDVWQEVLDGVREIRAGGGRRTLEQWEQGRRRPSGAARTLLKIVDRHPEVLIELAACRPR